MRAVVSGGRCTTRHRIAQVGSATCARSQFTTAGTFETCNDPCSRRARTVTRRPTLHRALPRLTPGADWRRGRAAQHGVGRRRPRRARRLVLVPRRPAAARARTRSVSACGSSGHDFCALRERRVRRGRTKPQTAESGRVQRDGPLSLNSTVKVRAD